jgi:hypothetical protein
VTRMINEFNVTFGRHRGSASLRARYVIAGRRCGCDASEPRWSIPSGRVVAGSEVMGHMHQVRAGARVGARCRASAHDP